jgi:hypothetical protein
VVFNPAQAQPEEEDPLIGDLLGATGFVENDSVERVHI